jgi:hypothetical protein
VFLFPLVWLFKIIRQSSDGLVLYTRFVFFCVSIASSIFVFRFFLSRVGKEVSWLLAIVFLLAPIGMPNLSYSMMGLYGATLGTLCLFEVSESGKRGFAVAAGILHAVGAASDPSQLLMILCIAVGALVYAPNKLKCAIAYFTPGLAIAAAMLTYAGTQGIHNIWQSSRYLQHSEFTVNPLTHIRDLAAVVHWRIWLVLVVLTVVAHFLRFYKTMAWISMVLPLACLALVYSMGYSTNFFFAYFGLSGALVFASVRRDARFRRVFYLMWVPAFVASVSITWTGNLGGVTRFGNGMLLGVWATVLMLDWKVQSTSARFAKLGGTVPAWTCVACLWAFVFLFSPYTGTAVFATGPFQGLHAEPERVEWLMPIQNEVRLREKPGQRILFHSHFPAGYLLTRMLPASNNVWWTHAFDAEASGIFTDIYHKYANQTALVVVVHQLFYSADTVSPAEMTKLDKIEAQVQQSMRHTLSRPTFDIYER